MHLEIYNFVLKSHSCGQHSKATTKIIGWNYGEMTFMWRPLLEQRDNYLIITWPVSPRRLSLSLSLDRSKWQYGPFRPIAYPSEFSDRECDRCANRWSDNSQLRMQDRQSADEESLYRSRIIGYPYNSALTRNRSRIVFIRLVILKCCAYLECFGAVVARNRTGKIVF